MGQEPPGRERLGEGVGRDISSNIEQPELRKRERIASLQVSGVAESWVPSGSWLCSVSPGWDPTEPHLGHTQGLCMSEEEQN